MENKLQFKTGNSIAEVEINSVSVQVEIYNEKFLRLKTEDKIIDALYLVNSKKEIVAVAEASNKDEAMRLTDFNLDEIRKAVQERGRYLLLSEYYDENKRETVIASLFSAEIEERKKALNEPLSNPGSYLEAVYLEDDAVLCYQNSKNQLMVYVCQANKVLNEQTKAKLLKLKSGKSTVKIKARLKKLEGMEVRSVILRYRSVLTYDNEIEYNIEEKGDYYNIDIFIDFEKLELRELYWDLYILAWKDGRENEISIRFTSQYYKCRFYLAHQGYSAGDSHIVIPYYTVANCIAFLYRESSKYDKYKYKLIDMIACALYAVAGKYWKKKHIWLVFEKFCTMAQDNGYYFFKYCMENLPEEEKKNIYYVIDKNAPDYENVKKYGKQVIQFMSIRHCIYILAASLYVGSDARSHLYAWRSKTSLIRSKMIKRPIFFLQHGVTALKDVSKIFGANGSSSMTHFTTTSKFEQEIVMKYLHYKKEDAPIVGFTRWDVLEDTSDSADKLVLMMPTWRSWLEEVPDEEFLRSDYYKNYSHLLQDDKLNKLLEKYNTRLIFYIHPKFASYQKNFTQVGERIELVPFGSRPLNEIIKKCHMLITDYSSVCWDVYYQKKPVVFYQFDFDKYDMAHGSFIDMETELFGRRALDEDKLLEYVEECLANDFKLSDEQLAEHSYYFEYIDNDNSKRTYEYLKERGY